MAGLDTQQFPVEAVTYFDAIGFCVKLSEREQHKPCYRLRAPSDGRPWRTGGAQRLRVVRGGCWYSNAKGCRPTNGAGSRVDVRDYAKVFRVVLVSP